MEQVKWFERKFDFNYSQNIFPAIIERLAGTPIRLQAKVLELEKAVLEAKPDGKWSIKEHVGHLLDLEPLWQGRLDDILHQEKYLRPADLSNSQTDEALHNSHSIADLVDRFAQARITTIAALKSLQDTDVFRSALHPRLHQPMRTMDLFLFVAEHDDHHLVGMTELVERH